jgi:hypothetical protein
MDVKQHLQTLLTRIENTKQAWRPTLSADDSDPPDQRSFAQGFLTCLEEMEGELHQLLAVIRHEEKLARLQQTVTQKRKELESRPDTLLVLDGLPSSNNDRPDVSALAERLKLGS